MLKTTRIPTFLDSCNWQIKLLELEIGKQYNMIKTCFNIV